MFDDLDGDMLNEVLKLDAWSTFKKETQLSDLLACLEVAAVECRTNAGRNRFPGGGAEQAAAGINAAQRIVEKIWSNRVIA